MRKFILFLTLSFFFSEVIACTSAIVSGKLTKTGRTLVWKNRDTGVEDNFVAKVSATDEYQYSFVGLFNAGDSLLENAWAGFNEKGFVIMNTASYNLAPDTTKYVDMEGAIMKKALQTCVTLDDFERLLTTTKKPMGVQANFGVADAYGNIAYYETDDYRFKKFPMQDEGYLTRTNYSYSGTEGDGYGYIRENNAKYLLKPYLDSHTVEPFVFTEILSRSFYHSLLDTDFSLTDAEWIIDQDFIPRYTSTASVVFELPLPTEDPNTVVMWISIGYPPCSTVKAVTINNVPEELQPNDKWHSPFCDKVVELKHKVFPIKRGSGTHYINLPTLKSYNSTFYIRSMGTYKNQSNIHENLNKK